MGRPSLSSEPSVRQQLVMSPELIRQIDAWRREREIDSRSEAIRQLCRIATVCCEQCFSDEASEDDIPS